MGKMGRIRWLWLVGSAALAMCGCENKDADHISQIARLVGKKLDGLTGGAESKFAQGLQAFNAKQDEKALDAKVSARLQWDKALIGTSIQVALQDGVVVLKGAVNDEAQRRRAMDLAESTEGADKVTDNLDVTPAISAH